MIQQNASDIPEVPPELMARRSVSLSPYAAEINPGSVLLPDGQNADRTIKLSEAGRKARERAQAFTTGEPLRGISSEVVDRVKAKTYPNGPAYNPMQGDRTPAFVNWLWATHPSDAKIRYAYREIWPTELPADWPPIVPVDDAEPQVQPQAESKPAIPADVMKALSAFTPEQLAEFLTRVSTAQAAPTAENAPEAPKRRGRPRKVANTETSNA